MDICLETCSHPDSDDAVGALQELPGVTLASFREPATAEALAVTLNAKGLKTWTVDERKLRRLWFLDYPREGVYVRVEHGSLLRAEACFKGNSAAGIIADRAIRCPQCRSLKVNYRARAVKTKAAAFAAILLALACIRAREFHCRDCHRSWR